MKLLKPHLLTAAVVVGVLILVFRFAPANVRKAIIGA
jgi:hypothetical protein